MIFGAFIIHRELLADYKEAESYFFDLDSIFYKIAKLYENKQNYEKSIYFYEQLIELTQATSGSPGYLERYYRNMGEVYSKAGNTLKAIECYKAAREYKKLEKEAYKNYWKKKRANQLQNEKEESVVYDQSIKKENKLPSAFVIDNGKLINQDLIPLTPLPIPQISPEREGEKGQSVKEF